MYLMFFFFSSRRRHTRWNCDWSSDVCSSDLDRFAKGAKVHMRPPRDEDLPALRELIDAYADALRDSDQLNAADHVRGLLADPAAHFRAIRPGADITDQ